MRELGARRDIRGPHTLVQQRRRRDDLEGGTGRVTPLQRAVHAAGLVDGGEDMAGARIHGDDRRGLLHPGQGVGRRLLYARVDGGPYGAALGGLLRGQRLYGLPAAAVRHDHRLARALAPGKLLVVVGFEPRDALAALAVHHPDERGGLQLFAVAVENVRPGGVRQRERLTGPHLRMHHRRGELHRPLAGPLAHVRLGVPVVRTDAGYAHLHREGDAYVPVALPLAAPGGDLRAGGFEVRHDRRDERLGAGRGVRVRTGLLGLALLPRPQELLEMRLRGLDLRVLGVVSAQEPIAGVPAARQQHDECEGAERPPPAAPPLACPGSLAVCSVRHIVRVRLAP